MKSSAGKIALAGLNDLFQTGGETVQEVLLSELFPFKNHPFQVRDDEAMRKTVESIVRSGVLSPGIVRPRPEGGYEIIAGHRRKRGSELAGRETMPVLIRMLDDDEATIRCCVSLVRYRVLCGGRCGRRHDPDLRQLLH